MIHKEPVHPVYVGMMEADVVKVAAIHGVWELLQIQHLDT